MSMKNEDIELEQELLQAEYMQAQQPALLVLLAQGISIVFHPFLILLYAFVLLAYCNPFLFRVSSFAAVFENKVNSMLFIWLAIFSFAVPLLTVLMMRALNFVSSLQMPGRMERIGPYIVVGLLYMVIFVNFKNNPGVPLELTAFALGSTIALFISFFFNLFSKISVHTTGMGGLVAMTLLAVSRSYDGQGYLLVWVVLLAGLVGTARLLLGAHKTKEVYGGYASGFMGQMIAFNYLFATAVEQI